MRRLRDVAREIVERAAREMSEMASEADEAGDTQAAFWLVHFADEILKVSDETRETPRG